MTSDDEREKPIGPAPSSAERELGCTLPSSHRLKRRPDILKVQEGGERIVSGSLLFFALANDLPQRRLGVTVSKRVGDAVTRNRIKRRFRELFRKHRALLPPSIDVVLIARASAATATFDALRRDFERAAAKVRTRPALGAEGRPGAGPGEDRR